ncbi:conserved hypothetical protein, partial [Ricinus communis]
MDHGLLGRRTALFLRLQGQWSRSRNHAGRNPEHAATRARSARAAAHVLRNTAVGGIVRNTATLFTRVLADLFPGKPANQPSTSPSAPAAATAAPPTSFATHRDIVPCVVGQGAQNETVITIGDTPHLFVDEGDHIVQFSPAFDDHTEETEFGMKIVPDLEPHWSQVMIHRCELKSAIATAIRQGNRAVSNAVAEPASETPTKTS